MEVTAHPDPGRGKIQSAGERLARSSKGRHKRRNSADQHALDRRDRNADNGATLPDLSGRAGERSRWHVLDPPHTKANPDCARRGRWRCAAVRAIHAAQRCAGGRITGPEHQVCAGARPTAPSRDGHSFTDNTDTLADAVAAAFRFCPPKKEPPPLSSDRGRSLRAPPGSRVEPPNASRSRQGSARRDRRRWSARPPAGG